MARADTASRVEVGALIAGTYEIARLLGRGGMGTVWEAHHSRLPGKRVAIKVLHPEVAKDTESLARFRREAEIASRIGHPNIVDVHDFNELDDGTPYLILEHLEGDDLESRLRQGAMPIEAVVALARQVGSALRAAHREGVIHRDLKPQNVFLTRTTDADGNESEMAKVLDFGISKIRGSQTVQTQDSAILGTPQYMAPEQATGAHASVDARTDVFALGAMVYEMLAGRPAFVGQTIPEVVFKVVYEDPEPLDQLVEVPPRITRAVHAALAKKQEERWQSVEEFIEALSGTGLSVSGPAAPIAAPVDEALASTIASGSHTPAPGAGGDIGTANTIDSGRLSPDEMALATGQTQLADSAQIAAAQPSAGPASTVPATAEPAAGGRGKTIALVLALVVLAAGGGAAAVLMSQGGSSDGDPIAAAGEVAPDAAAPELFADAAVETAEVIDASAPSPTIDAAAASPEPAERTKRDRDDTDRSAPARKSETKKHTPSPTEPVDDVGPDDPRRDLREARKLVAKNPREAIRLVRRAQRNGGRGQIYYAVLAMAHCKLLDLGRVRASLSRVKSSSLRERVIRRCKAFGMDLE